MAIAAAHSIADFAEARGISTEDIIPKMTETEMFPKVAADVAVQACKEGLARNPISWEEAYEATRRDIAEVRSMMGLLTEKGQIPPINPQWLQDALDWAVAQIG